MAFDRNEALAYHDDSYNPHHALEDRSDNAVRRLEVLSGLDDSYAKLLITHHKLYQDLKLLSDPVDRTLLLRHSHPKENFDLSVGRNPMAELAFEVMPMIFLAISFIGILLFFNFLADGALSAAIFFFTLSLLSVIGSGGAYVFLKSLRKI